MRGRRALSRTCSMNEKGRKQLPGEFHAFAEQRSIRVALVGASMTGVGFDTQRLELAACRRGTISERVVRRAASTRNYRTTARTCGLFSRLPRGFVSMLDSVWGPAVYAPAA